MKRLNKYYKNCPLNQKIRTLYNLKQAINNHPYLEHNLKAEMMRGCDKQIDRCWRAAYAKADGFEIIWPENRDSYAMPHSYRKY